MKLIELTDFMEDTLNVPAYPLQFPYNIETEELVVVDIINGDFTGDVKDMNIQLMYRSEHPETAEELADTHIEALHNMTNKTAGVWQVILIQCTSPNPFFNGLDENNKYIYTVNYRILASKS